MIFVDFNGNGQIDPEDIAVSLAMNEAETEDEDDEDDDIQGSRTRLFE